MSLEERCKVQASLLLPKDKYEIQSINFYGERYCYVDFLRKGVEAEVDCNDFCDTALEFSDEEDDEKREKLYDGCMDECKESKKTAEVGSIEFDPRDGTLNRSTIPASCRNIWYEEDMFGEGEEGVDFKERQEETVKKFNMLGCEFDASHIHPHEVARSAWESVTDFEAEREMEYPAICYVHPSAERAGRCKLKDVLKVVEEWV